MIFHEDAFKSPTQPPPQATTRADRPALTTRFVPPKPTTIPSDLFMASQTDDLRYVHKKDPKQILIFTAGASVREGTKNTSTAAGFAFIICPPALVASNSPGIVVSERLEHLGPTDDTCVARPQDQTASCASIRAAVAALQYKHWPTAGYEKIVIATHDEYLVDSIVDRVEGWKANGWKKKDWKTKEGNRIKNSHMWTMLMTGLESYAKQGLKVEFWKIDKAQNALAMGEAKKICDAKEASVDYIRLSQES